MTSEPASQLQSHSAGASKRNPSKTWVRHFFVALTLLVLIAPHSQALAAEESKYSLLTLDERIARIRVNRELTWSILENLITLEEWKVAGALLVDHLRVDPLDGRSWLLKGQIFSRIGNVEAAERSVLRGKQILGNSEFPMVRYAESEIQLAKGNVKGAVLGFKSVIRHGGVVAAKAERALNSLRAKRRLASVGTSPGLIEAKNAANIPYKEKKKTKNENAARSISSVNQETAKSMPWQFNSSVSLLTGYDANILQIADSLAPSAAGLGSVFSNLGAQAIYSGSGLGGAVGFNGTAGYTYNFSSIATGLNNLNASVGAQWMNAAASDGGIGFSVSATTTGTFMESGGYGLYALNSVLQPGINAKITDGVNLQFSLSGGINRFPGVSVTNPEDNREGYQLGANLGFTTEFLSSTFSLSLGHAQQFTEGANFRTIGYSGGVTFSKSLHWRDSSISSALSVSTVGYPNNDADRSDQLYSWNLGFSAPVNLLGQKVSLSPGVSWQLANSTVESAAFSKFGLQVQVVYVLQ